MMTSAFLLCAIPRPVWEKETTWGGVSIGINSLVDDVLSIERRIKRGVNADSERTRYGLCCARIEAAISRKLLTTFSSEDEFASELQAQHFCSTTIGASYLDILAVLSKHIALNHDRDERIGSCIFPPDTLRDHTAEFSHLTAMAALSDDPNIMKRLSFFQLAQKYDCGVIEIRDYFIHTEDAIPPGDIKPERAGEPLDDFREDTAEDELRNAEEHDLRKILHDQIQKAIKITQQGKILGMVNFSNQPHNVITEVLHDFVYNERPEPTQPTYIKVIYADGSQGAPLPLSCLPLRPKTDLASLDDAEELHVATMSMRHQEMDADVDIAWFRNREVSKSRSLGESDNFCYAQSKKQLKEVLADGRLRIFLYHTGFQPAIIGFYRALVEELLEHVHDGVLLEIIPYYHHRNRGYEAGTSWY